LGIGSEKGGAGAHRDKMLVEDSVRGGVPRDVHCNYSVPFVGRERIQSKKLILIGTRSA